MTLIVAVPCARGLVVVADGYATLAPGKPRPEPCKLHTAHGTLYAVTGADGVCLRRPDGTCSEPVYRLSDALAGWLDEPLSLSRLCRFAHVVVAGANRWAPRAAADRPNAEIARCSFYGPRELWTFLVSSDADGNLLAGEPQHMLLADNGLALPLLTGHVDWTERHVIAAGKLSGASYDVMHGRRSRSLRLREAVSLGRDIIRSAERVQQRVPSQWCIGGRVSWGVASRRQARLAA